MHLAPAGKTVQQPAQLLPHVCRAGHAAAQLAGAAGQLRGTLRQLLHPGLQLCHTAGVVVQAAVQRCVLTGKLVDPIGQYRQIAQHPGQSVRQLVHPGVKFAVTAVQGAAALMQLGDAAVHGIEIGLHGVDVGGGAL